MKRIFAAILVLMLVLTLLPTAAFAETGGNSRLSGICVYDGKLVYTDVFNKQVYIEEGDGYKVLAGKIGPKGANGEPQGVYRDGAAADAGFVLPWDAVAYNKGIAVSDQGSNTVRYIENGTVKTLVAAKAGLKSPSGLATDGTNLYIADTENDRIMMMDSSGNVKAYAAGISGPTGLAYGDGALYVCETDKNRIVKIADGKSVVLAGVAIEDGTEYIGGYVNGPLAVAQFDHPNGLEYKDGVLYVSDEGNVAIRVIKDGRVTTLNDSNYSGFAVTRSRGLAAKGDSLYVADLFYKVPIKEKIAGISFTDVAAADLDTVEKAVSAKIINGFPNKTFKPGDNVTRAQFVTMLSRAQLYMDGQVVINGEPLFGDVHETDWYAKQAYWAAAEGLLKGRIINGKIVLDPSAPLNGKELCIFISRLAEKLEVTYTAPTDLVNSTEAVSRLVAADSVVNLLEQAGYF